MEKHNMFYILIALACFVTNFVAAADNCFPKIRDHRNPERYFKENIDNRGDIHKVLVDKIKGTPLGQRPDIIKVLDYTLSTASSPFFRDQWESFFRILWVYAYSQGELTDDTLCVFANAINSTVSFENEKLPEEALRCILDVHEHLVYSAFNRIIENTLISHNCPYDKVPTFEKPSCFNLKECTEDKTNYEIDNVWDEYDENQKELASAGLDSNEADSLYPLINTLYESEDLFDNYVAAIYTTNVCQNNLLWKSKIMKTREVIIALNKLSIFEDALVNVKQCTCDELSEGLIERLAAYTDLGKTLATNVVSAKKDVRTHGHLKRGKGRRGKANNNRKRNHRKHDKSGSSGKHHHGK